MSNNLIGIYALQSAWPYNTPHKKYYRRYAGAKRYGKYGTYLNKVYPNRKGWGAKPAAGASCDVFAGTMIRASGADTGMSRGLGGQLRRVKTDTFKKRFTKIGTGVATSKLKGGDFQLSRTHARIVVELGGKMYVAEAGYFSGRYGSVRKYKKSGNKYTTYRSKKLNAVSAQFANTHIPSAHFKALGIKGAGGAEPNSNHEIHLSFSSVINQANDIKKNQNIKDYPWIEKSLNIFTTIAREVEEYGAATAEITSYCTQNRNSLMENFSTITLSQLQEKFEDVRNIAQNIQNSNPSLDLSSIIYTFEINILALKMQKEKDAKQSSDYFTTDAYLNDKVEDNGFQKGIIDNYDNIIKETSQLINEDTQKISELTIPYTQQISQLSKEMSMLKLNISNINKAITEKVSDYYLVQQEIENYENNLEQIANNIQNFEEDNFSDEYAYWNKNVIVNPSVLKFWLEFLDTEGELSQFNIRLIGDRPKAVNDNDATSIYFRETPQIIFTNNEDEKSLFTGYTYVNLDASKENLFTLSAQGKSVKDVLDENLYNYSYCAENISISAIPVYYLKAGTFISVYDENSHINGTYIVDRITLPLVYNGTMSVSAHKAPTRIL